MKHFALLLLAACSSCFQPSSESHSKEARPTIASSELAPRPDGPVLDDAHIIPAQREAELDTRLRQVLDSTQSAFIVVTVNSLGGRDVSDYANALARKWEVGAKRGGVLLLVAPNERQVRIETDDKVRTRLTDQQSAEIIQQVLIPRFKAGDFPGGVAAGVEAIASHL